MMRSKRQAGFTLIEVLVVGLILILSGLALVGFIQTTYGAQDTISGQNSADMMARQVLDTLADTIRNSQWHNPADSLCQTGCGAGVAQAISNGTATSITFCRDSYYGTHTLQYSLSGTNLQKSTDGGTASTILTNVQSLAISYYNYSDYTTPITLPLQSTDYPQIGAVKITATVSVTQMKTYTRTFESYVRLRNSPPPS